jgi:LuxR family maltose regulon positive regulatory protein
MLLIERRFVAQLAQVATSHGLTMLIGPAGSGKTIALQQLARATERNGARTVVYEPPSDSKALAARDFTSWLMRLKGGAAPGSPSNGRDIPPPKVVIIIDAYDKVDTSEMAAAIRSAIATDDAIRIVIAMRRKQNLNVSDLTAAGDAVTFDAGLLFFSMEETAQIFGNTLPDRHLRKVGQYTRGWPIAVRFIRDRHFDEAMPFPPGKLASLDTNLAEYIDEQILGSVSQDLRNLLICIAALDSIRPALIDQVCNRSDSAKSLPELCREVPGLVWRDDSGEAEVYRIIRPLRDRLLASNEVSSAERRRIDDRAVIWYREQLLFEHAIAQARTANVAGLLEATLDDLYIWRIFLDRGLSGLLLILKSLLPSEIAARPRLRLMASLANFKAGFYSEARQMLEEIRLETADFGHDPFGNVFALRRDARLIEICFVMTLQGVQVEDALFESAGQAADRNDSLAWATIEISRCVISEMRGELSKAMEAWRRSEAIVRGTMKAHFTEAWLPYHVPFIAIARGAYREALDFVAAISRDDNLPKEDDVPSEAMATVVRAAIAYERRFVEEAGGQLRDALDLLAGGSNWFAPCAIAYPIMFEVAHRTNGGAGIAALAAELRRQVSASGIADLPELIDTLEAAWFLRAGVMDGVEPLVERIGKSRARQGYLPWRLFDAQLIALFHWSLARGDVATALERAGQLIEAGRSGGRLRTMAKGRLLGAVALQRRGDSEAAVRELASVLGMTAHEQMTALFAEEGRFVSGLIAQVASSHSASAVARRQAAIVMRVMPLAEGEKTALNEREAEIAMCISQGDSNKIIARKIGLSEDTIKFHVKKIFSKLGVTGRKAVAQVLENPRRT